MYYMRRIFKNLGILFLVCYLLYGMPSMIMAQEDEPLVYTVNIEKTVTAGTYQHVNRAIKMAEEYNADAVVIQLNTPGGLVNATLDIIKVISETDIPVITYVTPKGSIAASAGTFILITGHVAVMTPGTTCGAAMPVTMSAPGDSPQAADQKTINFLAAHMKTIAEDRGRPGDIAARFVTENLSLNADEALEHGIIDYTADNLESLLAQIDGSKVDINDKIITLNTKDAQIVNIDRNMEEDFTNVVSNPTIAMILLMLGIYGLIIGFNSPGFFLPEVLGAIFLILGLYGIGSFEVNLVAGLLILLGVGLVIAEAFTPTYGILGVGGVISIVLGILLMPIEPMMPLDWFSKFKVMAVGVGVIGAGLVLIIVAGIWRLRKLSPVHGVDEFLNSNGVVIEELKPYGQIKIKGEIWNGKSVDQTTIARGESVRVVSRQGLVLVVEPIKDK